MKQSFIFNILKSTFIRVLFIIQASMCLLECIVMAAASFSMGAAGVLSFTLPVVMSVVSVRIILICAKGGNLSPHSFAQLVNYYGLILITQLFTANAEMPAEVAVNIVLCTAYVFMLISFWKPDTVKKVNFAGVLILFLIAGVGTCGITGYQMYGFFLKSLSEMPEITDKFADTVMKMSAVLTMIFSMFWYAVQFILPTAILVWIGKHKDDDEKSLEITV